MKFVSGLTCHLCGATYPAQALLRDLMLPALWIAGWRDRGFVWRGNAMNVDDARRPEAA